MHPLLRQIAIVAIAIVTENAKRRDAATAYSRRKIMTISDPKSVTVPEIALIAATRGAIGFGAGLLLSNKFRAEPRKKLGWTLLLSGLASTIPIAMHLFGKKRPSASAI